MVAGNRSGTIVGTRALSQRKRTWRNSEQVCRRAKRLNTSICAALHHIVAGKARQCWCIVFYRPFPRRFTTAPVDRAVRVVNDVPDWYLPLQNAVAFRTQRIRRGLFAREQIIRSFFGSTLARAASGHMNLRKILRHSHLCTPVWSRNYPASTHCSRSGKRGG